MKPGVVFDVGSDGVGSILSEQPVAIAVALPTQPQLACLAAAGCALVRPYLASLSSAVLSVPGFAS